MGQASNARGLRRTQIAVAVSLALVGSSAAIAAEPTSVDGLLQFANVRVINAPQAALSSTAGPQGGMRAYKDSAESALRGPTTEEMQAASPSKAKTVSARSASSSESSPSTDAPVFAAAGGGQTVVLDDSSLQYSVVVRQADGSLAEICVTGPDAANEIIKKQPVLKTAAKKEILNDR